jgi:methionine-gamma-lyase
MPKSNFPYKGFSSLAIHAGHEKESNNAHVLPIYASSSYIFDSAEQGMKRFSGEEKGYTYSRFGNPSFTEAEEKIALMEGFGVGADGNNVELKAILHSSGMAAVNTLLFSCLQKGDKVLTHDALYGGTEELTKKILPSLGINAAVADLNNLQAVEDVIKKDASIKMVYIETPSNPTIRCVDLGAVSSLAKRYRILVACDNTVATPYLQQPFKYDVDFVIHSTTKFLNGHGTAVGGVLIGKDLEFMQTKVRKTHHLLGGNSNPFDSFLLVNGLKTLELRMKQHCANATEVASFLNTHRSVARVNYNGLPSHPDYELSKKQMRHAGAVLSFELKDGLPAGVQFIDKLKMCTRAVSLGTCDTLISHPASMSHAGIPADTRAKYGITDGLIRMSVGIENCEDIIADLEQALG